MDINGVSAIVTGGASGLGAATARLLAEQGAKVVIADVQDEKGEALAKELGGAFVHTDVTSEADGIAAVDAAKELGPVRVLINCAGVGWPGRTIGKDGQYASAHSLDIFSKVIGINLIGSFNLIRLAATAISQEEPVDEFGERGAIVNTASVAAFDGQIGQAAYSASKGGVVGMTLPIARDLARSAIRVCRRTSPSSAPCSNAARRNSRPSAMTSAIASASCALKRRSMRRTRRRTGARRLPATWRFTWPSPMRRTTPCIRR